ncbi:MAG: glycosyltransferase family 2 protein, partial [Bacteroidota bacterium]
MQQHRVSVCIATYKRPASLSRLLESLARLQGFQSDEVEILVVDNDATGSAGKVCESIAANCKFRLRYEIETEQNIARARNRGVTGASGTYCAFVDDDEWVSPSWLTAHVGMLEANHLSGTFGPVRPSFEVEPPRWIVEGGYFARNVLLPEGEIHLITGNACLRRESLLKSPLFDEDLGLSGGEDTALFEWMSENGFSFGLCPEAEATEFIPEEKGTLSYLLRRAFRGGQAYVFLLFRRNRLKAVFRVLLGVAQLAILPCVSLLM